MFKSKVRNSILVLLLCLAVFCCCACSDKSTDAQDDAQPVIIEPGVNGDSAQEDPDTAEPPKEEDPNAFVDYGRSATLEDLSAAQAKVTSYYFEQTIPYVDGMVNMQVWYKDNKMKIVSSMNGMGTTEMYYDYNDYTVLSYTPSEGNTAVLMAFSPDDPDLPDQPKSDEYENYSVISTEEVNGQVCRVLQTETGDKLWISTLYGMPLQVEFTDSLGDRYTVAYENMRINDITDVEVAVPEGVTVYDMGSSGL